MLYSSVRLQSFLKSSLAQKVFLQAVKRAQVLRATAAVSTFCIRPKQIGALHICPGEVCSAHVSLIKLLIVEVFGAEVLPSKRGAQAWTIAKLQVGKAFSEHISSIATAYLRRQRLQPLARV